MIVLDQVALKTVEVPSVTPKHTSMSYNALLLTLINMFLTTSPYSVPYAIQEGGTLLGLALFFVAVFLSYNAAQMVVEATAYASAKEFKADELCPIENSPVDEPIKDSHFFIKKKIELYSLCKTFIGPVLTTISMVILIFYTAGNMIVKCVSSCVSLTRAVSYALYGDLDIIDEKWGFDPYYIAVVVFAIIATFFSLGNIENSAGLQMCIVIVRLFLIFFMMLGSLYAIVKDGSVRLSEIKLVDFGGTRYLVSNILYVTFWHHTVPGLIYPLRPQSYANPTVTASYVLQGLLLIIHSGLAVLAFGNRTNECSTFPCKIEVNYCGKNRKYSITPTWLSPYWGL
eukprot:TRINITY_DN1706_c0_g1_i7.p2 TRINITY_DN1706_c0_g1~~TRINITY_DN1706_c0_g1_i7.p2  ORF type:complete len:342 (-),score=81.12 TRINITY_DN1706_c0_g1_i7:543-1568(-)